MKQTTPARTLVARLTDCAAVGIGRFSQDQVEEINSLVDIGKKLSDSDSPSFNPRIRLALQAAIGLGAALADKMLMESPNAELIKMLTNPDVQVGVVQMEIPSDGFAVVDISVMRKNRRTEFAIGRRIYLRRDAYLSHGGGGRRHVKELTGGRRKSVIGDRRYDHFSDRRVPGHFDRRTA